MIGNTEERLSEKKHRELLGDTQMLYILTIVVETKIACVKIHQHILLRWVLLIIGKMYLHKMDLEKCRSYPLLF